jgi:hypothetical protein
MGMTFSDIANAAMFTDLSVATGMAGRYGARPEPSSLRSYKPVLEEGDQGKCQE